MEELPTVYDDSEVEPVAVAAGPDPAEAVAADSDPAVAAATEVTAVSAEDEGSEEDAAYGHG